MAGIAGIYCADGRPAEMADLRRITAVVEHRGPDGITYWNGGPPSAPQSVAFAHLQFHTTPESLQERQPLVSPGGEACLVWNGRVDNREELRDALMAKGEALIDETDPGLTMAAYLAWGEDCVQHIVGDFALAIWDARHRRLWCARDYIGVRPFYYFWDGKTFLFGPEVRSLLAHPAVSLRINEGMVGEYLADDLVSRDETLYEDIRRLPGGCHLTVDGPGRLRIQNWWNPDLSLLQYRNDEEYGEHFRQIFEQTVRAQMRCNTVWAVALSGGLDSSSIAVTAQALLNGDGRSGERVLTFSLVAPGKFWDESEDIAAIVGRAGLDSEMLPPIDVDINLFCQRAAHLREFPGSPNEAPMSLPIYKAADRRGARVVWTGLGGDQWLGGQLKHLIDLVAKGAVSAALRQARSDWNFCGRHGNWQTYLGRELLKAAVPEWAMAQRRKRALERRGIFSKAFLRRTRLGDRLYAPAIGPHHFSTRAQKNAFQNATCGIEAYFLESNDRDNANAGVESRFPFYGRRLVEFCLRLPEEQRHRGSAEKWVLRTAMGERLPPRIQRKERKAEFSDLFANVIHEPRAKSRLQNLMILRHTDWIEPRRFADWSNLPPQPTRFFAPRYRPLWRILGIDLWLENVLASGGDVSP